jgi:signal transduction histidine kinase
MTHTERQTQDRLQLMRQIGERRRASDAFERANPELETRVAERTAALAEAGRRKDEFLATLAHALRTPLSALRTASEALKLKAPGNADLVTLQGVFERQVQQLTRLTNDLLDVSRINRARFTLQRRRVTITEIIERAVENVRPLVEKQKHPINVVAPPFPVHVDGDPARLTQVLTNLLDNASRYSPPGRPIDLTVELCGPRVLIKVADNGIGIERERLPRLFDLFGPAQKTLPDEGGLGLGLPLAHLLTEMHGGTLSAYSAGPGRGSEFVMQLPILAPEPSVQRVG